MEPAMHVMLSQLSMIKSLLKPHQIFW